MCDPVTGTAIALSVAGAAAQSQAQGQVAGAQNRATGAEIARQGAYREKSYGSAFDTLGGVGRPAQDQLIGDNAAQRNVGYAGAMQNVPFSSPLPASNEVIAGERQRASGTAKRKGLAEALSKANLDAYGDAQTSTAIRTSRNAQDIGFNSGNAQGSSSILPLELENAQRAGSGMRTLGDLLTMGGSIAGMAGPGMFGGAGSFSELGARYAPWLGGSTKYIPPFAGGGQAGIFSRPLAAL